LGGDNGKDGTVPLWVAARDRVGRSEPRVCVPLRCVSAPHWRNHAFRRHLSESKVRVEGASKVYARNADSHASPLITGEAGWEDRTRPTRESQDKVRSSRQGRHGRAKPSPASLDFPEFGDAL